MALNRKKTGKHRSVISGGSLRRSTEVLLDCCEVRKVIAGLVTSKKHRYPAGHIRVRHVENGAILGVGYGLSAIVQLIILPKGDPEETVRLIKKHFKRHKRKGRDD